MLFVPGALGRGPGGGGGGGGVKRNDNDRSNTHSALDIGRQEFTNAS